MKNKHGIMTNATLCSSLCLVIWSCVLLWVDWNTQAYLLVNTATARVRLQRIEEIWNYHCLHNAFNIIHLYIMSRSMKYNEQEIQCFQWILRSITLKKYHRKSHRTGFQAHHTLLVTAGINLCAFDFIYFCGSNKN